MKLSVLSEAAYIRVFESNSLFLLSPDSYRKYTSFLGVFAFYSRTCERNAHMSYPRRRLCKARSSHFLGFLNLLSLWGRCRKDYSNIETHVSILGRLLSNMIFPFLWIRSLLYLDRYRQSSTIKNKSFVKYCLIVKSWYNNKT